MKTKCQFFVKHPVFTSSVSELRSRFGSQMLLHFYLSSTYSNLLLPSLTTKEILPFPFNFHFVSPPAPPYSLCPFCCTLLHPSPMQGDARPTIFFWNGCRIAGRIALKRGKMTWKNRWIWSGHRGMASQKLWRLWPFCSTKSCFQKRTLLPLTGIEALWFRSEDDHIWPFMLHYDISKVIRAEITNLC